MSHVDCTGVQPGAVLAVDYFSQVYSHVILSTHEIRYQKKWCNNALAGNGRELYDACQ